MYPTDDELQKIRYWGIHDIPAMMDFVRSLTEEYGTWKVEGNLYKFSTGGWSGNEDIIRAMMDNNIFWAYCWVSSRVGGHYEFEVKEIK